LKITLWGTRGSLPSPGPETTRYGGNTSCVQVEGADGTLLVLDAGTGIRRLGMALPRSIRRVDILLTHLHMDHIQGLGFFRPIRTPGVQVHVWGPASTTKDLSSRLSRYLSPPLFPVVLRELESTLHLHEVPCGDFQIGEFTISASLVCHPDPTVGFRISSAQASMAYLPDHEPAMGVHKFPLSRDWTSGFDLANGVDLLIHDGQYNDEEYRDRIGWGHSSMRDTLRFASLSEVKQLVPFHHDPSHTDDELDRLLDGMVREMSPPMVVSPGKEGATFEIG
jgi:phosphoribosyl 1,2-cyclic phosphodiesterase